MICSCGNDASTNYFRNCIDCNKLYCAACLSWELCLKCRVKRISNELEHRRIIEEWDNNHET